MGYWSRTDLINQARILVNIVRYIQNKFDCLKNKQ